ncbi:glutamyl-tRNA reductase [Cryobacterium sp. TMT1-21]|uniref:Glutamyl-tRNA reductase n=1 Tax=Cryobacterium shii TaxID=1259235 RepID=A0AAQ2HEB3_9MICO|nr:MULTISPECIES: glutamyl-tRNA reductase [Cryobacterium]TFC41155.1 glutamyl-tRNA reductase [Cryobacterium shii]TFC87610.1 glutamyl-tRNA reductase [Cryobacterium sp. TmT2-59]TFD07360.1 glutamyl-tRNA reductase [Cryobacterium sp. TMT1-21]TFD15632.1 glutamyl-tRNA reductase [Cryobacterium sp. TMT2-23]TFD16448.1 glutamyl-tRNA reductase [Cryobacterium sp. TMT4-10]
MLICLSASHKNSSFEVLERLSVGSGDTAEDILERHPALVGAVIVATCNRFEAYLDLDEPAGASPLTAIHAAIDGVSASTGVTAEVLRGTLDLVHGSSVAEHLFAVTSGLESVVVGEGEIAGQVRRSLEQARLGGTTSPELERLFQRASQTSRGVKNRTGIGAAGRSLVRLALELAESRVTDWGQTRVLLVGTGRYAGASLAALRDLGAEDVRVYSPSGRARKFASSHQITAVAEADFAAESALADLILTCTTADDHVVNAALLRAGLAVTAQTPVGGALPHLPSCPTDAAAEAPRRLIIDLGLPRNVDPDVTELAGVELLDLETIRIHAPLEELNATSDARLIVGRAARKFSAVAEEQSLAPAVVALRSHVFDILDGEILRARGRGDSSEQTEAALRHLAGVLLHTPMVRSRELARAGEQAAYLTGLGALFGIEVQLPAAGSSATVADIGPAAS